MSKNPISVGIQLVRDERGVLLVTVALGWFFALGMRHTIPALLPQITTDFSINNTTAGIAISLLMFVYAAMQLPAGYLIDRFGERTVLLVGLTIGLVGVGIFTTTPTFGFFLVACGLFGLGTGLYGVPRITIFSNFFPKNDGTALGLTFAAGNIGSAVLPFVGGILAIRYGWRTIFVVVIPLLILVTVSLWRGVPSRPSYPGGGDSYETPSLRQLGAAVVDRPVLLASLAFTLMVFSLQGLTAFLPTYFIAAKGLTQSTAAALYGLFFACGALIQPFAGNAADRYGDRIVLVALSVGFTAALVLLTVIGGALLLTPIVVLLALRPGISPVSNGYVVAALPDDVQGTGYGILRTVNMGIGSTGPAVVGAMIDRGLLDEAFLLLAGLTVVSLVAYMSLPSRDEF